MLEIFLTTLCLISLFYLSLIQNQISRNIENVSLKYEDDLKIIHRYLLKTAEQDRMERFLMDCHELQNEFFQEIINEQRKNIITQMGDLATKHDFCKLQENIDNISELRAKLKSDRFKNMRIAFGGKEED